MNDFLSVIFGRWKEMIVLTMITALMSVIFGFYYNQASSANTIFMTVAARQAPGINPSANPSDTALASDQFSETVMGWFKNPMLMDEIRTKSQYDVDLNVRKQEKQNLVATFRTSTPDHGKKIAMVTEETLRREIGRYNLETGSEFRLPVFSFYAKESSIHLLIFALIGTFLGMLMSYFLCAMLEKFLKGLHQFRHGKL